MEDEDDWVTFEVNRERVYRQTGGGETEDIPVAGSDERTELMGVFYNPVGPYLPVHFHNESDQDLQVIIGAKFGFDLFDLPRDKERQIQLKPNHRARHQFGLAPVTGEDYITARVLELNHEDSNKVELIRIKQGQEVSLVRAGGEERQVRPVSEDKIFKQTDNQRVGQMEAWVTAGNNKQLTTNN